MKLSFVMSQASSATSTASLEAVSSPTPSLNGALQIALDPRLAAALDRVLAAARSVAAHLYLVGGVPRDLLLGRCHPGSLDEVDLTVTAGHAALVSAWPLAAGRLVVHPRFGTRSWSDDAVRLDLVQARAETYGHPGALPQVRPGDLAEDLARRDFSINAIAWGLAGPDEGLLVDPHGGRQDLAAGLLRVLHAGSFMDDPTRVWRGLRYARRLGFALAPRTAERVPACLPVMAQLSGRRLAAELGRVWSEPDPLGLLSDMDAAGALTAVTPDLRATPQTTPAVGPAIAAGAGGDLVTAALLLGQSAAVRLAAAVRLDLPGRLQEVLEHAGGFLDACAAGMPPDAALVRLDRIGPTALALLSWATADEADGGSGLSAVLARQREAHFVDGDDLLAQGLRPSPELGRVLTSLRAGQLRGEILSRADAQLALAALTGNGGQRILPDGGSLDA